MRRFIAHGLWHYRWYRTADFLWPPITVLKAIPSDQEGQSRAFGDQALGHRDPLIVRRPIGTREWSGEDERGLLVVLKGHLVFEEVLRAKLEATLQDPMQFRRANLGFYQVVCLAHAVFGDLYSKKTGDDMRVWDMLEAWNKLRNELAHRVEPDTVEILGRLIFGDPNWSHGLEHLETQIRLHNVVGWLCGVLSELQPKKHPSHRW